MANWLGLNLQAKDYFRHEEARTKIVILQAVRLGFLSVILLITLAFQIRQADFINYDVLFPLYAMLTFVFFVNGLYTFYLRTFSERLFLVTATLFVADTLFITGLIYFTDFNQSIFLFMYLINIILCGMLFRRTGALVLSLLTSLCFSFLVVIGPPLVGAALYFTMGINNLAFVSVALLSGYLSEQLNFMGIAIKARDEDIKVLQNFNKMIVDNIAAGLMTIQSDGMILHCNPSVKSILETDLDLTRKNLSEVFPEVFHRLRSLRFEETRNLGRFEIIYVTPKNERLLLGCSASPIKDMNSLVTGYILIFQDLTEIKRLERAVQRSEKLAAVGQLAAGIAHEIRNPLASISGSVQLLKAGLISKTSDDDRLMAIVLKEIDRLNHLISEFLDFVRPEAEADKIVDVDFVLREVLDMVRVNTRLRNDVVQKADLNCKRKILGNADKLKQVFLNLVINSYQAMEKTQNPMLKISSVLERGIVRIKIHDNGIGMSESVVKRLFEPFFTTKTGGTGLGLATTHKIIENHEARIFVESYEGKGTEFVIEFTKLAPNEEYVDNKVSTIKRGHG